MPEKLATQTTKYQVAVWWPKEQAYGSSTSAKSLADALAEAVRHETLGYANDGGEIHIIKTVRSVHVYGR